MTTDLSGQIAIVTGGSRGLGYAIAGALAAAGADIALLDIRTQVREAATRLAEESGRVVVSATCDVVDPTSVAAAFESVTKAAGRTPTILINCAGIASDAAAADVAAAEWSRVIDVNISGTFFPCQRFARNLIADNAEGVIVNISSMSGFIVNVPQPQAAYNTSKAAVAMLTKSLAVEWHSHRIRVNAIAPGYFETDMTKVRILEEPDMVNGWVERTPAGRMGQPSELGALAVYLCSRDSSFVVGQTILIDGGYTIV